MDATFPGYSAAEALRRGGRETVRQALLEVRDRTLAIADAYSAALAPAKFQVPRRPDVNPPLWEWGHLAWFQEYWIGRNRQRSRGTDCEPEHERGPSLLAGADVLYDSGRVAHSTRWGLNLPDEAGTRAYLADTLAQTIALLDGLPREAGDSDFYFFRLVALHEAMHAEAACYMARTLDIPLAAMPAAPMAKEAPSLKVPAQLFRLGHEGPGFAFDNELRAHDVQIAAFEIDAQPVSGSRFAAFAEAGGYRERKWWSDKGWSWLQSQRLPATLTSTGAEAATHLSAHEAEAWCRWAARRLPTEAEWECATLTAPGFIWGPTWEWTASTFLPYAGFQPHPYRDYSQPWFETRRVLRGACPATSPWLAHPRYRNFFEPQRNDIFAGFRSCAAA